MEPNLVTPARFTIQNYLQIEDMTNQRHEFRDGHIIARASGSPDHSLIIANIIGELGNHLKGKPCRVYDSNLRVRVPRSPLYTYPDVTVICGEPQFDPHDTTKSTATNPRLIVEVLSKSSEADDRGEKFRRYLMLDTLEQYVLVSQQSPLVETFSRLADGTWRFAPISGLDSHVHWASIDASLPLSEIYAGIHFPPEEETATLLVLCPA